MAPDNTTDRQPRVQIHLFGPLSVQISGVPMERLRSRKEEWLLALLTLRAGKEVSRDWLAGTLWPDHLPEQALPYLRQTLYHLKKALGEEADRLQSPTARTLTLDLSDVFVDVLAFEIAVKQEDTDALEEAIALYRGPLLEGCEEEWVYAQRQEWEQAYLQVLERRAQRALEEREPGVALPSLRLLVQKDPLRESAHRLLMEALAADGNIAAMQQAYRDLRILLQREVGAEPTAETTALYARLRAAARRTSGGNHVTEQEDREPHVAAPIEENDDRSPESPLLHASSAVPPSRGWVARIPQPLTRLIGRDQLVDEAIERLDNARLVTLSGPGGVGKTRVSLQVAETLALEADQDIWVAELAALPHEGSVVDAVARVAKVAEVANRSLEESLIGCFSERAGLLVLDNCEHVLSGCATLCAHLLTSCRSLRILTTSRQPLGVVGEVTVSVPPLDAPPVRSASDMETLGKELISHWMEYGAVRLFVERAQAVSPQFRLTQQNAGLVGEICRRLDGIPLAIELAAARVKSLPVEQIARLLDDRFRLLKGGSRAAYPRQQTLQALLDWSYALLTAEERTLLGRLSVFVGGWTLDAAEVVCNTVGVSDHDGNSSVSSSSSLVPESVSFEVLDPLTSLVDKSLVQYEERSDGGRYRLQETVRQYGLERLKESGEVTTVSRQHRDYFHSLAQMARPRLLQADQKLWLERLDAEHDNLIAALAWCREEPGEAQTGLTMANALQKFWRQRGYWNEGRWQFEALLAHPGPQGRTLARAEALSAAGSFAESQGDFTQALAMLQESIALQDELQNWTSAGSALSSLAHIAAKQGDYPAAEAYCTKALALAQEQGNRAAVAGHLNNLGNIASEQGRLIEARTRYEEALQMNRAIGNRSWEGINLDNLGNIARQQGDYRRACSYHEQALAIQRELGYRDGEALSMTGLAQANLQLGQYELAKSLLTQALSIQRNLGNWFSMPVSLSSLGQIAEKQGDYTKARSYFAEALAIARERRSSLDQALNLSSLGRIARLQGQFLEAVSLHEEALQLRRDQKQTSLIAESLTALAALAADLEQPRRAATLFGAVDSILADENAAQDDEAEHVRAIEAARSALGDEAFQAAREVGRAMSVVQAVGYALTAGQT